MSGVIILSGGMDSVTLLHSRHKEGVTGVRALSFNYGQRHDKELWYAKEAAERLDIPWECVSLPLQHLLPSSLTSPDQEVPEGHYQDETMKQTIVPGRNAIMLSIAAGYSASFGGTFVATAVHAGDHAIYPDCTPIFIRLMTKALNEGLRGVTESMSVLAPFVHATKADIVALGSSIGVDYSQTWSCYKGGRHHCGKCGTCVERKEAFELARVPDPTTYE